MTTSTKIANLVIEDTEFPLLTPTIITQQFLEKDGNQVPISKLALLNVALDALQPNPPNATTVWFDNTLLLDDGVNAVTLDPISTTYSSNATIVAPNYSIDTGLGVCSFGDVNTSNNGLEIAIDDAGGKITIDSTNQQVVIGDCNDVANITKIDIRDQTRLIDMIVNKNGMVRMGETTGLGNDTKIIVDDLAKDITLNSLDFVRIGDINGALNSTNITLIDSSSTATISANSSINLQSSSAFYQIDGANTRCYIYGGLRYRAGYTTTALTTGALFTYGNMTYNGSSISQTLGTVSANTVGFQILITNVNATNLTMSAGGGQLIYSTIGAGTASKTLNTAHSHIFTAIQVGASTYGWSMV